ncbi:unnamed protein product, partial [Mesorhabditis spiculigera]
MQPSSGTSSLAPSSTSAFSTYRRENSAGQSTASTDSLGASPEGLRQTLSPTMDTLPTTAYVPLSPQVVRPRAVRGLPPRQLSQGVLPSPPSPIYDHINLHLPQEDQSDSVIFRKIRGKDRGRHDRSSLIDFRRSASPPREHHVEQKGLRRESAFSPIHRRPNDPIHRNQDDGAALIYTQETLLNESPASFGREPSPLSHTGSTPPPEAPKPPPLSVTIPTPKARRSINARWVKETDIDDPASLPVSPACAMTPDPTPPNDDPPTPPRSAPIYNDEVKFRNGLNRRVFTSENDSLDSSKSTTPSGHYVRRTGSRNERSPVPSPMRNQSRSASRSSLTILHPIQFENVTSQSQKGRGTPDTHTKNKDTEAVYHQMTSSAMNALAYVSENLSSNLNLRDGAIPKPEHVDFNHFTITQYGPLRRRSDLGLPALLEIEDHDGSISSFLRNSRAHSCAAPIRNPKAVVMNHHYLFSLHSLAALNLSKKLSANDQEKHVAYIMIQLLGALKNIQSDAIEHLSTNFKEILLAYRETNLQGHFYTIPENPRLLFLSESLGNELDTGETEYVGLCRYALRALCTLLHHKMDGRAPQLKDETYYSRALLACGKELEADRGGSLTRAKNILELTIFSPQTRFDTEYAAKLWLDAQRADCLQSIVRRLVDTPENWPVADRLRVDYLLSITPKGLQIAYHTIANTHF